MKSNNGIITAKKAFNRINKFGFHLLEKNASYTIYSALSKGKISTSLYVGNVPKKNVTKLKSRLTKNGYKVRSSTSNKVLFISWGK